MKKHYVRKSDLVYLGQHGSAPKNSYEIPEGLVHKQLQIDITLDGDGLPIHDISIDSVAQVTADTNKAQEELDTKYAEMRAERNRLLTECDYTQLNDAPIDDTKKAEYVTYRQALRDLPSTIVDIDNFSYPTKPE